jgi:hypothetical protein
VRYEAAIRHTRPFWKQRGPINEMADISHRTCSWTQHLETSAVQQEFKVIVVFGVNDKLLQYGSALTVVGRSSCG